MRPQVLNNITQNMERIFKCILKKKTGMVSSNEDGGHMKEV